MIEPRSDRTFYDALALAGLPAPTSLAGVGERFLDLLLLGLDHELTGSAPWLKRILADAPDSLARRARHRHQRRLRRRGQEGA